MANHTDKASEKPQSTDANDDRDGLADKVEEGLEELAGTFNAGPKAGTPPEDPAEGEQWAPG
jgi:hypothetical protein